MELTRAKVVLAPPFVTRLPANAGEERTAAMPAAPQASLGFTLNSLLWKCANRDASRRG
jgi:hypothetical protein